MQSFSEFGVNTACNISLCLQCTQRWRLLYFHPNLKLVYVSTEVSELSMEKAMFMS